MGHPGGRGRVHRDVLTLSARREAAPVGARGPAGSTEAPRVNAQTPHPQHPAGAFLSLYAATVAGRRLFGKADGEERFPPTIKDALYAFLKTQIFLWKRKTTELSLTSREIT